MSGNSLEDLDKRLYALERIYEERNQIIYAQIEQEKKDRKELEILSRKEIEFIQRDGKSRSEILDDRISKLEKIIVSTPKREEIYIINKSMITKSDVKNFLYVIGTIIAIIAALNGIY